MPICRGMVSAPLTEDHTHVRFRLRNVQAGAAISTVAASGFFLYELQTWDRPHRSAVAALYVLTIICSAILWRLDLEPVMRRPALRETFFLVWSAIIVGLVSVGPITDGGAHSPLTAGLFSRWPSPPFPIPWPRCSPSAPWSSGPISPSPSAWAASTRPRSPS